MHLSRNERKTLIGERLKAASCGFIRLQTDSVLRLCWREKLREKERRGVFKDTMEHTRLILKVRDDYIRYAVVRLRPFWSEREYPEMH